MTNIVKRGQPYFICSVKAAKGGTLEELEKHNNKPIILLRKKVESINFTVLNKSTRFVFYIHPA